MNHSLSDLLSNGHFDEAVKQAKTMKMDQLEAELLEYNLDAEDIGCYTLLQMLIKETDAPIYHHVASVIVAMSLHHYPGGYRVAYYHARKALDADPTNLTYNEFLLLFNDIPDKLLSDEEAEKISEFVVAKKPGSDVAKRKIEKKWLDSDK